MKTVLLKKRSGFKSGTKEFPGSVVIQGDKLKVSYRNSEIIEKSWLAARVSKLAQNYDNLLTHTYEERGNTIFIEADDKNIRMKTKETRLRKYWVSQRYTQISDRDYYIKVDRQMIY